MAPGRAEWQLWPLRATTPIPSHEHTCRAPHSSCAHIPEEGVNQAPDWLSFLIWLQGGKTRPTIRLSRPVHSGKPLVPSLVQSMKLSRCVPSNTLAAGGSPASHDTHVGTKYPLGKPGARERHQLHRRGVLLSPPWGQRQRSPSGLPPRTAHCGKLGRFAYGPRSVRRRSERLILAQCGPRVPARGYIPPSSARGLWAGEKTGQGVM